MSMRRGCDVNLLKQAHLYPWIHFLSMFITIITISDLTINIRSCLFVCFVALRPKSTAMVIAGRSVHLTTLFPGQA